MPSTQTIYGGRYEIHQSIAKACEICKLLDIKFTVSAYDCTEGRSGHYEVHWSSKKQKPLPGRFANERMEGFLQSLRKDNEKTYNEQMEKKYNK